MTSCDTMEITLGRTIVVRCPTCRGEWAVSDVPTAQGFAIAHHERNAKELARLLRTHTIVARHSEGFG
jgi:hypothetical protein